MPHIPALRRGSNYQSLDKVDVLNHRTGEKLIEVSQVNAGIVRRDLPKFSESRTILRQVPMKKMLEICKKAGQLFLEGTLPLGDGDTQSPQQYVEYLSASSGLPHVMVRQNMTKVAHVMLEMSTILAGLTRGLDLEILDRGHGKHNGSPVSFYPVTQALGIVLPSNSPGVNSLWIPAIALKIPVVLKPGREEPWTPYRIIQALVTAGIPKEAFGFYSTDHEGAGEILKHCERALLFGDESTTARWASNPGIQIHGPGRSKILIGEDVIEDWPSFIDVIADSICRNGGRSCVNCSGVIVPKYGKEIAEALAKKLGPISAKRPDDPTAALSAFANVKMADWINDTIEDGLKVPGAEDLAAKYRGGERKQVFEGGTYMRPTIVHCDSFEHPLANREFLFPFAAVSEIPQAEMLNKIGQSLVVTAITKDESFKDALLISPLIDRLNLGTVPTCSVSWDQPHEGNLFELLYRQRAILVN